MSSFEQKNELYSKLNAICDVLRKTMDASEYRNYILGFIFYKYISEKFINLANELLEGDNVKYLDVKNQEIKEATDKSLKETLGYFIKKEDLFSTWVEKLNNGENILSNIEDGLKNVEQSTMGLDSENDFKNLFGDINFASSKLGNSPTAKNNTIKHIILNLNEIKYGFDDAKIDILGDAYEHLIANFASEAGKKAGEFYTPQEVSQILAKIVTSNMADRKILKNAYDPTCGSGSLLLQISKLIKVGKLCGQEVKDTTFNLCRMNMFLRGKDYHDFDIRLEDTILHPQHLDQKFDVIVANPPFSLPWDAPESFLSDPRFSDYGKLAPKSKMDYAFIQHMIYHLADDGTMATIMPHGVLFRGAAEGTIRQYIIEKQNYLDAVIGLPANIFYGTSIPSCILVFKKNRKKDDPILFIEASREFEKGKNQNKLSQENINKIVDAYANKKEIEKYSRLVNLDEIKENEYNLNITRYVDTFEEEEEIDIEAVNRELKELNLKIAETEKEIEEMIKELVESK
ncbi:type I restriction-modification system subunit M [Malacoplasma muris]|uniref:type I restriction-modification system subunit M n=1 Tax=Malacoplasma muris TaxID=2119 RepID=UPI00398E514A